jgi:mannonate dehydratase
MLQTWRWFGPGDPISLQKIRQAGAEGIVTALHEVPTGEVWTREAILERTALIEAAGLRWSVVESLPVHPAIRLREPGFERYVDAYTRSLEHLGDAGVKIICYNFMPIVDWTRTDLDAEMPDGTRSLRFDSTEFAAFDLFILARPGAERDYTEEQAARARALFESMSEERRERLLRNVVVGVPGESGQSLKGLRRELDRFAGIDAERLREHWVLFLRAIMPTCERWGLKMCVHPDDPPRPILGLPRIASRASDFEALFAAVPSPANGLTLCFGSLGAGRHNDLGAIARQFAERVHFTHLRAVHVEQDDSFVETDHLDGDADLVDLVRILVHEERRRQRLGEATPIAMRPDHGRVLEGDIVGWPGYPWLGRLKALSELRGVLRAVERLT